MSEQCKERVYGPNSFTGHQCLRNSVKDEYCNQHHPEAVEKRRKKRAAKFKYDREHDPLFLANKKIEQLTKERDELVKDIATAIWLHPEWGYTTLPPSTWESIEARGDKP